MKLQCTLKIYSLHVLQLLHTVSHLSYGFLFMFRMHRYSISRYSVRYYHKDTSWHMQKMQIFPLAFLSTGFSYKCRKSFPIDTFSTLLKLRHKCYTPFSFILCVAEVEKMNQVSCWIWNSNNIQYDCVKTSQWMSTNVVYK